MSRTVVDTNVFVSAILLPRSAPRQAVDRALDEGVVLFSEATLRELEDVIARRRFDPYLGVEDRKIFIAQLALAAAFIPITRIVRECRDPNHDKFLEVAINGRADAIVTGDMDLLRMHPWNGVQILKPGGKSKLTARS